MHSIDRIRDMNAEAIGRLAKEAAQRGIRLMVENLDRLFSGVDDLKAVLDAVPEAGFHLDVGHANLRLGLGEPNRTKALREAYAVRLDHWEAADHLGGAEGRPPTVGSCAVQ